MQHCSTDGRVLLATRDFQVGQIVMTEPPLLVWESDGTHSGEDILDFLDAYDSASEETQRAVLDCYHPDLNATSGLVAKYGAWSRSTVLAARLDNMPADLIHKLLMIKVTNAHSYSGAVSSYSEQVMQFPGGNPSARVALFNMGSKVNHACVPNTQYSSKRSDGMCAYTAVRQISAGEMVTFSYLGDKVWQTPTVARRADLLERYGFECHCAHCEAGTLSEPCRRLRCPSCGDGSSAELGIAGDASGEALWSCAKCGALGDQMLGVLEEEAELTRELEVFKRQTDRDVFSTKPSDALRLMKKLGKLSPTHHVVVEACCELTTYYASLAHAAQNPLVAKKLGQQPAGLREQSATWGMRSIAVCESIAAGCFDGTRSPNIHAPVHECARACFFMSQDLLTLRQAMRPPALVAFASRYLEFMKILYGPFDADVAQLESELFAGGRAVGDANVGLFNALSLNDSTGAAANDDDWTSHTKDDKSKAGSQRRKKTNRKKKKK